MHSGFAEILQDKVTFLAEIAEWPDEIDVARAEAAKERAEKRLASHQEEVDVKRAEYALRRALVLSLIHIYAFFVFLSIKKSVYTIKAACRVFRFPLYSRLLFIFILLIFAIKPTA